MASLFTQTREEQYTLTVRVKNIYMKISEECWLSIIFRLNGRDQESDSIPLAQSDVNKLEVAQIVTNTSFSQSMTVKVSGNSRSKNTGRNLEKSAKGSNEKFSANPFELLLLIYN